MAQITRYWPSFPSRQTETHYEPPKPAPTRPAHLLPILVVLTVWNVVLLASAIVVVAAAGNGPDEFYFEAFWINREERMYFLPRSTFK